MTTDPLETAVAAMRAAGVADVAIRTFAQQHGRLAAGEAGMLPESTLVPVADLPDADDLPAEEEGARAALEATVIISLNGGLGTSMGMTGPKALLPVKQGLTFLDITARQVLGLRARTGARVPWVLMNSFATREASLAALSRYDDLPVAGVPTDFVQSKVPKLRASDLVPVRWPDDPALEWAPPGHGDLYTAIQAQGTLDALLAQGYRYAFVANVDNLGAVLEPRILAWFAGRAIPFLMEVTDRTPADRKGGHLARRPDGGLVLREIAQTPAEDLDAFQDITRHRYFNTNSLWIDLQALKVTLDSRDGLLGLPMIVNRKTVDPTDATSTPVIQLETAMGAAIDVMAGAQAIRVPRSRFSPVKTTDDLLALRSDAYVMTEDAQIELSQARAAGRGAPLIRLDPTHFKLVEDFEARFVHGPPSLVDADRLVVRGDVTFGADVTVRGDVEVINEGAGASVIADGTTLSG